MWGSREEEIEKREYCAQRQRKSEEQEGEVTVQMSLPRTFV